MNTTADQLRKMNQVNDKLSNGVEVIIRKLSTVDIFHLSGAPSNIIAAYFGHIEGRDEVGDKFKEHLEGMNAGAILSVEKAIVERGSVDPIVNDSGEEGSIPFDELGNSGTELYGLIIGHSMLGIREIQKAARFRDEPSGSGVGSDMQDISGSGNASPVHEEHAP